MWEILHWIFLYLMNPNPFMHVVACTALTTIGIMKQESFRRRDIATSICLFVMYVSFYMDHTLEHIAFQPWWCVSIIGLRYREFIIWLGGIMVGLYLIVINPNPTAHVAMNVALLCRGKKISLKARAMVHILCMMLYVKDPNIRNAEYKDVLAGLSAVMCAFVNTPPDYFSLAMVFTSPVALCTFILHALELNWYKFYKNNHFKIVKNSYYFIYTISIVALAYGYNLVESVRNVSVFWASS